MTRPKVPEEKRQRTAQACESCKRRKQKCNGGKPCSTCSKRNLTCSYGFNNSDNSSHESGGSPTKRRHIETSSPPGVTTVDITTTNPKVPEKIEVETTSQSWERESSDAPADVGVKVEFNVRKPSVDQSPVHQPPVHQPPVHQPPIHQPSIHQPPVHHRNISDNDLENHSRNSTISGADEEADLLSTTRMLADQTGRLLYLGDSATLSYLHLFRFVVENVSGPSPFTTDPRKGKIVENVVALPPHIRPPCMTPDRRSAEVLVDAYFTNTSGLIEAFDRTEFDTYFDKCYSDPLSTPPSFLCLLYLTFAIGLVLATPRHGSPEDEIIKRFRSRPFDQAELFFRSAKCFIDPLTGFEDADLWSVQALLLMSVYMLSVSKRNAAWAYHGMAVRSAFALGLHREEPMVVFPPHRLALQCHVWRSLFVLDRFLAASLGRPTAISEDDCSEKALLDRPPVQDSDFIGPRSASPHDEGIDAAVRSCRVIGTILKKIYAPRVVRFKTAQDLIKQCVPAVQKLHPVLQWRGSLRGPVSAAHGVAILHANLLYCHSVILLTRPLFIFVARSNVEVSNSTAERATSLGPRMEKLSDLFAEVCVAASYHTIALAQAAWEANHLPQRNPFVMYFLFAAALVVLSNEYAMLFQNDGYQDRIDQATTIMAYSAKADPQGDRLLWILKAFRNVVDERPTTGGRSYRFSSPTATPHSSVKAILDFFSGHASDSDVDYRMFKSRPPGPHNISRHNSLASLGIPSTMTPAVPPIKVPAVSTSPDSVRAANGTSMNPLHTPGLSYAISAAMSVAEDHDGPGVTPPEGSGEAVAFDTLWNWPSSNLGHPHQTGPTVSGPGQSHMQMHGSAAMGHQHQHQPHRYDAFVGYGMPMGHHGSGHSNGVSPGGNNGTGMHMNVPLYTASDLS